MDHTPTAPDAAPSTPPDPDVAHERSHGHDLDRSMGELLQELRVAQTGVQVFFAFLLTIPFAPGFEQLSTVQRDLYAFDVLAVVIAMSLLVAPVAIHRVVFGQRMRPELVAVAHVMTIAGLLMLLVAVIIGVTLVSTLVFPTGFAARLWLPLLSGASLILCWIVIPVAIRLRLLKRHRVTV